MKNLLGIVVLGLLLSGNAYAEIIKNRCYGFSGVGNEAGKSSNIGWVEHINTQTKTYKSKLDGRDDWMSMSDLGVTITNFGDEYFEWKTRSGNTARINFIKFTEKTSPGGYLQYDCVRENFALKPKNSNDNKIVAASSGTGFFISKQGHIVTNQHVIDNCSSVKVNFYGKEYDTQVISSDKMNDLAIIKTNMSPAKVFSVETEDASLLEDVIIAGYPLGKKVSASIKTSKGSVTALAGYGDNFSEFQTDAAMNKGNSGGPIINQKGNIVGVAVAAYGKKQGVESFNFGIKASTLKTFVTSNGLEFLPSNKKELSNKDLGNLITDATVYLECYMEIAKIKEMVAAANNRKAFFSEYQ